MGYFTSPMPSHLMIDIETLSTQPNSAILSIGAMGFHPAIEIANSPYFYIEIDPESQGPEFHRDPETITWWTRQPQMPQGTTSIEDALNQFAQFLKDHYWAILWANSPSFDLVILKSAFRVFNISWPFNYWAERDVRTLADTLLTNHRLPVKHNALHDCQQQILKVQRCYALLATVEERLSKSPT